MQARDASDRAVTSVTTEPFEGQRPDFAGLRKKTTLCARPRYLENYFQSVFHAIGGVSGRTLVAGGDGRYLNDRALDVLVRVAAAGGAARVIVGREGILSTPALVHLVRLHRADLGVALTAGRWPGGANADFGIKLFGAGGVPADARLAEAIHDYSRRLRHYFIRSSGDFDPARPGRTLLGMTAVMVVDPVADYAALMERSFDFTAIAALARSGFRLRFDAMHGAAGPYARKIFEERLGFAPGTVVHATPLADFAEMHPDPVPRHAGVLLAEMARPDAPDLGAAADADADRVMIVRRGGLHVGPSDNLALFAAHAGTIPALRGGLRGIVRSMPSSTAPDRVAAALGIRCYETPPGWCHLAPLLESGLASLGGEESFGAGGMPLPHKDAIWTVLMWLSILAAHRRAAPDGGAAAPEEDAPGAILAAHWRRFGRTYHTRHDFEALDPVAAERMMSALRAALPTMRGTTIDGMAVAAADDFVYRDPVSGATSRGHGVCIRFENDARIVLRLAGTAAEGATLRLYLERHETAPERLGLDPQEALAPLMRVAHDLAGIRAQIGRDRPNMVV